jgi:hypothetical protein
MAQAGGGRPAPDPIDVLVRGADSYRPYLQDSGELHDPIFGEPTQYGTAYHAYVNATLALIGPPERCADFAERALRGIDAALKHTADPALPAAASGFARDTGSVTGRGNHRDFTWPPILKAFRLLREYGIADEQVADLARRISAVDIERSFRSRPPSNWASVWVAGEWIRVHEGLSPYHRENIDDWVEGFFSRIDLDLGWYEEPGKPNSYDLFTRFHLIELLAEGYSGRMRDPLRKLVESGLRRSLAVQLSDGSLASAHRSAGQSWTDGVQIAYFTYAAGLVDDPELSRLSAQATQRAMASLCRWQRPDDPFSPVHNLLPASRRIGYEGYTADAHYGNLALGFLATAVLHGFRGQQSVVDERPPAFRVEQEPTFRAVAHHGRLSVAVNGAPAPAYDGFGITDLTFGAGRLLHFGSSARAAHTEGFCNVGLALRPGPGRTQLDIVSARTHTLRELVCADDAIRLRSKVEDYEYVLGVRLRPTMAEIEESTPGLRTQRSIVIPYLLDGGFGPRTRVQSLPDGVALQHGTERVEIRTDAAIESVLDLPHDWENRRGLCGLLRIDLAEPAESVLYRIISPY